MSQSVNWKRPYFQAGGGEALVLYLVFGQFPEGLKLNSKLGSKAVVERIVVQRSAAGTATFPSFALHGFFGASLDEDLDLRRQVNEASTAYIIRGDFSDPMDLDYLTVMGELVAMAIDNGAVAILDMMSFRWWHSDTWLTEVWQVDQPSVFPQVSIYNSALGEGVWVRTRGLRSFGRPDLSIRKVHPDQIDACVQLINDMISFQAFGGRIQPNQPVKVEGLPEDWSFHLEGSEDDPTYNNPHWEIC